MLLRVAISLILVVPRLLAIGSTTQEQCYMTLRPGDSLQQALNIAPPNSVICLQAGVYGHGENVDIDNAWLTVRGAGTGKTVIVGSFSVSWSGPRQLRGRSEPSIKEVRFSNLTVLPPLNAYAAIITQYFRRLGYKPGRIVLENVELLGDPTSLHYCSTTQGVTVINDMELEVINSVFYNFEGAIETFDYYQDPKPSFRIKVADSSFFHNCKAVLTHGGSLELVGSRLEHNNLGILGLGEIKAVIQRSVIAEQRGAGIIISDDAHIRIEDSIIVRNGNALMWKPGLEQAVEPFDVLRGSGIILYGKTPSDGTKTKIVLSVHGGAIRENFGWGIAAELAKCGNFGGEDAPLEVHAELRDVEIAHNNRNWIMEGDVCLP